MTRFRSEEDHRQRETKRQPQRPALPDNYAGDQYGEHRKQNRLRNARRMIQVKRDAHDSRWHQHVFVHYDSPRGKLP